MKKTFLISLLILFASSLLFVFPAYAGFNQYKIVGAMNDTNQKSDFGWDETPYLYVKFLDNGGGFPDVGSFWRSPEATYSYLSQHHVSETWLTLPDWNVIKKIGRWEVNSNYFYDETGSSGAAFTSFNVSPEPMAVTLFLIGGLPIAVNLYRKKKLTRA